MIYSSEIASVVKGKCLTEGHHYRVDNLLTDSRKISHPASSLFIPLVSARRNAHSFIADVYAQGVRVFLLSEDIDISLFPKA